MYKRTDTQELDIPKDDIECWERYTKHRWVYDMSRLLDAQNIKWSPFESETLNNKVVNMYFESCRLVEYKPAYIYINELSGLHLLTEVYIAKGDIKLIRYIDKLSKIETQEFIGNIELRINAFISMHFQKFTGVITIESVGNDITSIRLRAHSDLGQTANSNIIRLIKRIYKKTDLTLTGPTDQVIHETLTS